MTFLYVKNNDTVHLRNDSLYFCIYHFVDDAKRDMILIPVETDDSEILRLVPIDDATFCDTEWLRQGFFPMSFDEQVSRLISMCDKDIKMGFKKVCVYTLFFVLLVQDGILFIHSLVPMNTAEELGVPSLMSRMLHAEELNVTGTYPSTLF